MWPTRDNIAGLVWLINIEGRWSASSCGRGVAWRPQLSGAASQKVRDGGGLATRVRGSRGPHCIRIKESLGKIFSSDARLAPRGPHDAPSERMAVCVSYFDGMHA